MAKVFDVADSVIVQLELLQEQVVVKAFNALNQVLAQAEVLSRKDKVVSREKNLR